MVTSKWTKEKERRRKLQAENPEAYKVWMDERKRKEREAKKHKRKTDTEYRNRENKRSTEWANKHRQELSVYYKDYRRSVSKLLKQQVVDWFGGKCMMCGYDKDIRALQIDHINGDGHIQRKNSPMGNYTFYRHILKIKGKGFQLLCANCNQIKKFENNETSKRISKYAVMV